MSSIDEDTNKWCNTIWKRRNTSALQDIDGDNAPSLRMDTITFFLTLMGNLKGWYHTCLSELVW